MTNKKSYKTTGYEVVEKVKEVMAGRVFIDFKWSRNINCANLSSCGSHGRLVDRMYN